MMRKQRHNKVTREPRTNAYYDGVTNNVQIQRAGPQHKLAPMPRRQGSVHASHVTIVNIPLSLCAMTYRQSRNIKYLVVRSYHEGVTVYNVFGSSGPRPGCYTCRSCISYRNIERITTFSCSGNLKTYQIRHHITCNTEGVIYVATCPCNLKYVGLTTQKLKATTREYVLDIMKMPHLMNN